jgi:hypothetical protein
MRKIPMYVDFTIGFILYSLYLVLVGGYAKLKQGLMKLALEMEHII